jgi:hypothetical protein
MSVLLSFRAVVHHKPYVGVVDNGHYYWVGTSMSTLTRIDLRKIESKECGVNCMEMDGSGSTVPSVLPRVRHVSRSAPKAADLAFWSNSDDSCHRFVGLQNSPVASSDLSSSTFGPVVAELTTEGLTYQTFPELAPVESKRQAYGACYSFASASRIMCSFNGGRLYEIVMNDDTCVPEQVVMIGDNMMPTGSNDGLSCRYNGAPSFLGQSRHEL